MIQGGLIIEIDFILTNVWLFKKNIGRCYHLSIFFKQLQIQHSFFFLVVQVELKNRLGLLNFAWGSWKLCVGSPTVSNFSKLVSTPAEL